MSDQQDLFSPGAYKAPFARGSETSQAAAESIEPTAMSLCGKILAELRVRADGMTCDEIEQHLQLRHQTASARVWDLRRLGHIVDSGNRRPTASGRKATVWIFHRPDVADAVIAPR